MEPQLIKSVNQVDGRKLMNLKDDESADPPPPLAERSPSVMMIETDEDEGAASIIQHARASSCSAGSLASVRTPTRDGHE